MRFLLRADASPTIGAGHAMRMIGLAEQLLAAGHQVHLTSDDWPDPVKAKAPKTKQFDSMDFIEVIDSYTMKPYTRNAIRIPPHFWFLRDEIRKLPRGRKRFNTLGVSVGGFQTLSLDIDHIYPDDFDGYAAMLTSSDAIIGGYGTAMWERLWLGIPSIGVMTAEDQRDNRARNLIAVASDSDEVGELDLDIINRCLTLWRDDPDHFKAESERSMAAVPTDSYADFWWMIQQERRRH